MARTVRRDWQELIPDATRVFEKATGWTWVQADDDADLEEATDMIATDPAGNRFCIAVRQRKYEFYKDFPCQFTLRTRRASGAVVEYTKIMCGYGDLLFYVFHNRKKTRIHHFFLINLDLFRGAIMECGILAFVADKEIPNTDGTTWFRPFDIDLFILRGWPILWMEGGC